MVADALTNSNNELLDSKVDPPHRRFPGACQNGSAEIIGRSGALDYVLRQVQTVAATDSTVVILGETGTGKELIARAIHSLSFRRQRALIRADCASIPAGALETELFGHERGAFTGAINQMIGRFELAHGGTLFLDEVGDIPLELQSKLLRVLQEQELERLGSSRTLHVDFRLVAATHRDLTLMLEHGQFRSDLYYLSPAARNTARRVGTLAEAEREHILQALRDSDWVVGGPDGASAQLGVKRTTLLEKMRRLGISRPNASSANGSGFSPEP